jgi:predicted transcriptional regulator
VNRISLEPRLEPGYRKAQLHTRIDPELKVELGHLAIQSGRPLCTVIEEALDNGLTLARGREARSAGVAVS